MLCGGEGKSVIKWDEMLWTQQPTIIIIQPMGLQIPNSCTTPKNCKTIFNCGIYVLKYTEYLIGTSIETK
jgi:hypothetical protein